MVKKRWSIPKQPKKQAKGTKVETSIAPLVNWLPRVLLLINGLLTGAGYLFLAGYLSKLGIEMGELEISLPTLLLHGYVFLLESMMKGSVWVVNIAIPIVSLVVAFLFYPPYQSMYPAWSITERIWGATCVALPLTMLLVMGPSWTIIAGSEKAEKNTLVSLGISQPDDLLREHTVATEDGNITGTLVIADKGFIYLRSDNSIYKISNTTGQVARRIDFSSSESATESSGAGE
ncbi:hypothetical protein [Halopseudomonas pelagia]|uniref:Uncharacterized protein n=1 Tax=Halopseudomonas pelagia TaxID=553151 RepID=A0AA91U3E8_9GAMM|nr:hypothetical protein [Halopseudomonas pelagia]PCC99980.1 hypothetical protein CO192_07690 [Halopseudomonas pelagia]QFY57636.1 hypothetical protein EAO82_15435 [Halopseudomonas pelagia]